MLLRLSKIALVATSGLFLVLVVFNNLTDYPSNYAFIEGVMSMRDTFAYERNAWRAVEATWMHNSFYIVIIVWEAAAAGLIAVGVIQMTRKLTHDGPSFRKASQWAIAGLVLSMLQWYLAFITVGGEWFLMWQNSKWNGQDAAFRMFAIMGISLLFLVSRDASESKPR